MAVLGWVWLTSPFAVIALIYRDRRLLTLVAEHLPRVRAVGVTGVAMLLLGATVVSGVVGEAMFWIGTPLVGLVVWIRRDDGNGGDEPDIDLPPIDWGAFERSFWSYVIRRSRGPRTPFVR